MTYFPIKSINVFVADLVPCIFTQNLHCILFYATGYRILYNCGTIILMDGCLQFPYTSSNNNLHIEPSTLIFTLCRCIGSFGWKAPLVTASQCMSKQLTQMPSLCDFLCNALSGHTKKGSCRQAQLHNACLYFHHPQCFPSFNSACLPIEICHTSRAFIMSLVVTKSFLQ